jgi:hypothetical protein
MIRMKGNHHATRTSCFAGADRLPYPECRTAASLAVPAGPRWVPCSDLRPVGVAHWSAAYVDSTKTSAAGSILHMACTRAGTPWFD